jgi:hypothetical protein
MKRSILSIFSVWLSCFVLVACTSNTQITGAWKSPALEQGKTTEKILVTAMTSRANARERVESDLAKALQQKGYAAVKSIDIMPPSFTQGKEPDKEVLVNKIKGAGVDAILTVALIDKETDNRYVPGSYGYEPIPRFEYYGRFWGYYNVWYPRLYSPGYYQEDKIYFLETNLYDAKSEELLWSAQSETYNPANLESFSREFATAVLDKMEKDNVLK